jgi:hypothetical protein
MWGGKCGGRQGVFGRSQEARQGPNSSSSATARWFTAEIEALRSKNPLEFVDLADRLDSGPRRHPRRKRPHLESGAHPNPRQSNPLPPRPFATFASLRFTLFLFHFSLLTSHFSLLTSHFSLLTSHFSLLTRHFLPGRQPHLPAPPNPPPLPRHPPRKTLPKVRRSLRPALPDPHPPETARRFPRPARPKSDRLPDPTAVLACLSPPLPVTLPPDGSAETDPCGSRADVGLPIHARENHFRNFDPAPTLVPPPMVEGRPIHAFRRIHRPDKRLRKPTDPAGRPQIHSGNGRPQRTTDRRTACPAADGLGCS